MRAQGYAPYAARICFECMEIVGGNQMNLKSMSISRLTDLRHRVEGALASKVIDQRRAIQSELTKITRLPGSKTLRKRGSASAPRGSVTPQYPNPPKPTGTLVWPR